MSSALGSALGLLVCYDANCLAVANRPIALGAGTGVGRHHFAVCARSLPGAAFSTEGSSVVKSSLPTGISAWMLVMWSGIKTVGVPYCATDFAQLTCQLCPSCLWQVR